MALFKLSYRSCLAASWSAAIFYRHFPPANCTRVSLDDFPWKRRRDSTMFANKRHCLPKITYHLLANCSAIASVVLQAAARSVGYQRTVRSFGWVHLALEYWNPFKHWDLSEHSRADGSLCHALDNQNRPKYGHYGLVILTQPPELEIQAVWQTVFAFLELAARWTEGSL